MRGLSEVTASALLLAVSVALAAAVVSTFFNVVYSPSQSQLVLESARPLCKARVIAVADGGNKSAVVFIYNPGDLPCTLDRAYAICEDSVTPGNIGAVLVPPGGVARVATPLPFSHSCAYRLTGPRGEIVEGRP